MSINMQKMKGMVINMKSEREKLIEGFKNAAEFEAAILNKVRNEFDNVPYEPAACYAAAYVVYHVQGSLLPEQKYKVIDFETLFKLGGASYKSKQKFLRDSLGENINKLNDLFFVFPQQAVEDYLNARGMLESRA